MRLTAMALCVMAACGCSGRYIMTVPDHVAPAGGQATAAMRLQRAEFGRHNPPVGDAAVRFQVEQNHLRAAYTDKAGYAVANVPVGSEVGKAVLTISIMDKNGREAQAYAPVYVLDPSITIVAVDLDAVVNDGRAAAGKAELNDAARHSYVIYFTRECAGHHADLHRAMERAELPDGPILQWQGHKWAVAHMPWIRVPYYAFSPHVVSPLEGLRKQFPGLQFGLCSSDVAAAAFTQAGLKVTRIGGKVSPAPTSRAATRPATQPATATQPTTTISPSTSDIATDTAANAAVGH